MLTFLGGLVFVGNVTMGFAQTPTNRPPDPLPIAASCCGVTVAPAPAPPPQGTNRGLFTEPRALTSLIDAIVSRSKNEGPESGGPYVKFGASVPGAGWIAAGPGYRHVFDKRLWFDASAVVSWRQYLSGRARLELRPLANKSMTLGAQVLSQDWTQVQYFGVGQDSPLADRSIYRLRATDVTAHAVLSPGRLVDVRVRAGMLNRPRISGASGWHKLDYPDAQSIYNEASAPGLTAQPRFWHADVSVSRDTLDHPEHPTRGLFLELAAAQFDDRDFDRYSFRRYELTTAAFVPIVGNRWTIGVRGLGVASETSGTNQVPFYMLPNLGRTILRGFDQDRLHDRNLMALNVESRWALYQHLDFALFGDFGQVAPTFGALNLRDGESTVGVGLRLHTGASTVLRIDAARAGGGRTGWKILVKLNDSLSVSKHERWNTVVPVVR
ncbi:MAG: BamA/TamA family outer membrane protein [Vicinamibacterales bacterium]